MGSEARILIAVGGYGGMYAALRLEELLRPGEATVMVAGPRSYLTYQPLLAGAAAGNLVPRHVVVLLCAVLRCTQVIKAAVSSIDHGRRLTPAEGGRIRLDDGEEFPAGVLVWSGGVAPSPLARPAGLLTDTTDADDGREPGAANGQHMVEVMLHVHGSGSVNDLATRLSELPGVCAVTAEDANATTG